MTVSEFLVSVARIYEAGARPVDPNALARRCRDYAILALHKEPQDPPRIAPRETAITPRKKKCPSPPS